MKRLSWISGLLGLLIWPALIAAQAEPDSALRNFRLPMFNEFGHRIWDLRAAALQELGQGNEHFELTNVYLRILAGDPDGTLEAELTAPQAVVDLPARTVSGQGQLHVKGRDVELFGNDWICYADEKRIVVEHDVVITFNADLGNILR